MSLTAERFLSAAVQCMSVEKDVSCHEVPPEVLDKLKALSTYIADNKVRGDTTA